MRRVFTGGILAVLLLSLALAAPGAAQKPAEAVRVHLGPKATLGSDGIATGTVRVSCPRGLQVLEAGLTFSQDDQAIFGEGFIQRITCDGKQRWYSWRAFPTDTAFHTGSAYVSAFVIVTDEDFQTDLSGGDTRIIAVR